MVKIDKKIKQELDNTVWTKIWYCGFNNTNPRVWHKVDNIIWDNIISNVDDQMGNQLHFNLKF